MVPILLLDVPLVWGSKKFAQIHADVLRVQSSEDMVFRVYFLVFLLVEHHTIEEIHVCAPTRDCLQAFFSVSHLGEEL